MIAADVLGELVASAGQVGTPIVVLLMLPRMVAMALHTATVIVALWHPSAERRAEAGRLLGGPANRPSPDEQV
ncbi:hypothetical protein [Asanoa siamensis]|uniref:Uncharacterized protein n=1 Tax=Asanoa siamensis TaxID=926357 RepID=A0ABQ4CRA5_9ACTN|nr:hypothetical protein [Asanoa siamensis]GIF73815.1 hypothetical protein Asi02nite_33330 [Asanoa siamensis]